MLYRFLAFLMPTSSVHALVNFLDTFQVKLIAAEAKELTAAEDYARQIEDLNKLKETSVDNAARARRVAERLTELTA